MSKTYVLVGADHNGALKDATAAWEKRATEKGDVEIIRAKPGQSLEEAMKQVQPPGNVVLLAHGGEHGTFGWNEGQSVKYSELFEKLPRNGIASVTIASCYGGTAVADDMLAKAPAGTLVQSIVGAQVVGLSGSIGESAREVTARKEVTPLSLLLESLDAVNPKKHSENIEKINQRDNTHYNSDSKDVLPHTIGLGGNPPVKIDLNDKMADLSKAGKEGKLDHTKGAFKAAIDAVKDHFDASAFEVDVKVDRSFFAPSEQKQREEALDKKIDAVALRLEKGDDPSKFSLEEKRIAYALTAAELSTSGKMDTLVKQAQGIMPPEQAKALEQKTALVKQVEDIAKTTTGMTSTSKTMHTIVETVVEKRHDLSPEKMAQTAVALDNLKFWESSIKSNLDLNDRNGSKADRAGMAAVTQNVEKSPEDINKLIAKARTTNELLTKTGELAKLEGRDPQKAKEEAYRKVQNSSIEDITKLNEQTQGQIDTIKSQRGAPVPPPPAKAPATEAERKKALDGLAHATHSMHRSINKPETEITAAGDAAAKQAKDLPIEKINELKDRAYAITFMVDANKTIARFEGKSEQEQKAAGQAAYDQVQGLTTDQIKVRWERPLMIERFTSEAEKVARLQGKSPDEQKAAAQAAFEKVKNSPVDEITKLWLEQRELREKLEKDPTAVPPPIVPPPSVPVPPPKAPDNFQEFINKTSTHGGFKDDTGGYRPHDDATRATGKAFLDKLQQEFAKESADTGKPNPVDGLRNAVKRELEAEGIKENSPKYADLLQDRMISYAVQAERVHQEFAKDPTNTQSHFDTFTIAGHRVMAEANASIRAQGGVVPPSPETPVPPPPSVPVPPSTTPTSAAIEAQVARQEALLNSPRAIEDHGYLCRSVNGVIKGDDRGGGSTGIRDALDRGAQPDIRVTKDNGELATADDIRKGNTESLLEHAIRNDPRETNSPAALGHKDAVNRLIAAADPETKAQALNVAMETGHKGAANEIIEAAKFSREPLLENFVSNGSSQHVNPQLRREILNTLMENEPDAVNSARDIAVKTGQKSMVEAIDQLQADKAMFKAATEVAKTGSPEALQQMKDALAKGANPDALFNEKGQPATEADRKTGKVRTAIEYIVENSPANEPDPAKQANRMEALKALLNANPDSGGVDIAVTNAQRSGKTDMADTLRDTQTQIANDRKLQYGDAVSKFNSLAMGAGWEEAKQAKQQAMEDAKDMSPKKLHDMTVQLEAKTEALVNYGSAIEQLAKTEGLTPGDAQKYRAMAVEKLANSGKSTEEMQLMADQTKETAPLVRAAAWNARTTGEDVTAAVSDAIKSTEGKTPAQISVMAEQLQSLANAKDNLLNATAALLEAKGVPPDEIAAKAMAVVKSASGKSATEIQGMAEQAITQTEQMTGKNVAQNHQDGINHIREASRFNGNDTAVNKEGFIKYAISIGEGKTDHEKMQNGVDKIIKHIGQPLTDANIEKYLVESQNKPNTPDGKGTVIDQRRVHGGVLVEGEQVKGLTMARENFKNALRSTASPEVAATVPAKDASVAQSQNRGRQGHQASTHGGGHRGGHQNGHGHNGHNGHNGFSNPRHGNHPSHHNARGEKRHHASQEHHPSSQAMSLLKKFNLADPEARAELVGKIVGIFDKNKDGKLSPDEREQGLTRLQNDIQSNLNRSGAGLVNTLRTLDVEIGKKMDNAVSEFKSNANPNTPAPKLAVVDVTRTTADHNFAADSNPRQGPAAQQQQSQGPIV